MAFRARRVMTFSRIFFHSLFSVNPPKQFERMCLLPTTVSSFSFSANKPRMIVGGWGHCLRWYGTAAAQQENIEAEFLELLESTVDIIEGPHHYWLNMMVEGKKVFRKDGVFFILVNAYIQDSPASGFEQIGMLEKLKLLQQRFPELQTFGLQCGAQVSISPIRNQISKMISNENITFPILLSSTELMPANNGAFYILFDGFGKSVSYFTKDVELADISNEISQLDRGKKEISSMMLHSKSTWVKHAEIIKEPSVCRYLKNLLLDFAGCISVDESSNQIFLSDTNHHRIIVTDGDGHILDCIGSSPGFEDGGFDTAKMMRPASSMYNATENCLYFVDSENHAIRCADLEKRVVNTLYPVLESNKNTSGFWSWLLVKLGIICQASENNQEHDMGLLRFPWHIMKLEENGLFITNRSFDCLWFLCTNTGEARSSCEGLENVMDFCKPVVKSRLSLVEKLHGKQWLQPQANCILSDELTYANLMSSVANFGERILLYDRWQIIQFHKGRNDFSSLQISNLGILGVPYWLDCPLERVFSGHYHDAYVAPSNRLLQHFNVQSGRCNIKIHVGLPVGTKLAAPVQDGCFWCQTRGSAVEVSRSEGASTPEVGVAQQFYDELDDLAFATEDTAATVDLEEQSGLINHQEDTVVHIDRSVNTSPGTSEVVVCAVFYLRLGDSYNNGEVDVRKSEKILGIPSDGENRKQGETSISLLLESRKDLGDMVFMRSLHLRIKLKCRDASTDRRSEIVRTDSDIEVNVSLT